MQKVKLHSKIQNFKFLIVIFIFSFLFLNLATKATQAQSLSLSIWPPLLEVMMQPGKSITQVYKLKNNGETDLAFTSSIVPFKPADELGNIKLENSRLPPWFSFQNANLDLSQKFLLKAGETQEVVLKIKVPEQTLEKDYHATLLFETIPGVFLGQSGMQTQAKIGSNILLTVSQSGQPLKKAEIVKFAIRNLKIRQLPIIDSFTKPQFLLRIKNTGPALFKPAGAITASGWFGQKYVLNLLPENVLVNSTRLVGCENQIDAKFLLGPYKTKVEFGLDTLETDYSAEITFFALPIKFILGIIIAVVVIWFVKAKLGVDKRLL
ncbi:MAG TPA: hypothetical protein VMX76_04050 [Nevskiaceae bacterium]|nr:hypothetical protein [Nevskiaceae bacterium]